MLIKKFYKLISDITYYLGFSEISLKFLLKSLSHLKLENTPPQEYSKFDYMSRLKTYQLQVVYEDKPLIKELNYTGNNELFANNRLDIN